MRALDAKLLRDLRRLWAQGLAIGLVLACGIMVLVLAQGASRSLTQTRDAWYERHRFAEVFASVTRAPRVLLAEVAHLPGVALVEGRVGFGAVVDIPGLQAPAQVRILSLPANGAPVLNLPLLRMGSLPDPLRPDEVALSEPFAQANNLVPGSRFHAILGGQRRELTVTGHVLSPEFVYTMGPGSMMPDDQRFGIVWMGEAAASAAADMQGAFNDLSLSLTRDGSVPEVVAALDRLLAPYGGQGAHGRDRQSSHVFLQNELDQLQAMALVLPPIFLIVAAFLVNMVLGRLIAQERPVIGLLKAVGYSTRAIGVHYLKLSLGVAVLGVAIGWASGHWLGQAMTRMYADFFRFPWLIYVPGASSFWVSGILGLATVLLGALRAVWASVRLPPAVAMSPPAPPTYRRGVLDRLAGLMRLRQTTMMILRSITRFPGRASVTVFGVTASVAVLVASFATFDAITAMLNEVFEQSNRQHVTLSLAQAQGEGVIEDARRLPGVLAVEGAFTLPVRLVAGHRSHLIGLEARADGAQLTRIVDDEGAPVPIPPDGIVIPATLAATLHLAAGDRVQLELLAPPRETWEVTVAAVVRQSLGQSLVMAAPAMFERLRSAPQVNMLHLSVDLNQLPALHEAVKTTPAIAGLILWTEVRAQFDATISENLSLMTVIYTALGVLITFGVVYNSARIQLSERAHELASLRVLGFSRGEVGFVLIGEAMLLAVLAVPLGWLLGYGFAVGMMRAMASELIDIPAVVARPTFVYAGTVVLAAALGSVLVVRRRLDRVEIASALKQRN